MDFNEYQNQAMTFRMPTATPMYAVVNYAGETGELCSLIAKGIRDGVKDNEEFRSKLKKELGDGLWHIAAIAMDNGFSLREIAEGNINKLSSRSQRGTITGSGDNR